MKKTLHMLVALLITATLSAQTFDDGQFTYNVIDAENNYCEVTGWVTLPDAPVDVVIPETVNNMTTGFPIPFTVTQIGVGAFSCNPNKGGGDAKNTNIQTVTLPASVKTLSAHSFRDNPSLTSINLEHIVHSGSNTFVQCDGLTGVMDLPACTTFGAYTFVFCDNITGVNIPVATVIEEGAMRDTGIVTMDIPSSVTRIEGQLFRQCDALVAVQLNWADPTTVVWENADGTKTDLFGSTWNNIDPTTVNLYVPTGTSSTYESTVPWDQCIISEGDMPELTVGNTFTVDGINYTITSNSPDEAAVSGVDTPMAAITVPATATDPGNSRVYDVTAIGAGAFLDDTTLTSVALPTSVTVLKSDAFSGCTNLETINLENIVTLETQNVFLNCFKLTSANLASATSIGNFAFHTDNTIAITALTSINIPVMETIGRAAFRTAQMPSINIPATVTSIGTISFMDCTALTAIQVNWTDANNIPVLPTVEEGDAFTNLTKANITLYVPTGTSALYAAAAGWQDFNIEEGVLSTKKVDAEALGFSVYPNPTNGVVSIKNNQVKDAAITVYDVNGRALMNQNINTPAAQLNLTSLSKGIYILRVQVDNSEFTKRIVKQ